MISDLGHAIEQLTKTVNDHREISSEDLLARVNNIFELETPFHNRELFGDLYEHSKILTRLAATNILALLENKMESMLTGFQLEALLEDPNVENLIMYGIKHGIMLALAEQKALQQASEGLAHWIVAPSEESHPNSNPPVLQPGEPPSTSSQSAPEPSGDRADRRPPQTVWDLLHRP